MELWTEHVSLVLMGAFIIILLYVIVRLVINLKKPD
jgi:hypothetical protein